MAKNLPPLPHNGIPLGDLAKDWECSEEKIIHYGIAGQLKICVLSGNWDLQVQVTEPDGWNDPVKETYSDEELLPLKPHSLKAILKNGEVRYPDFIFEDKEYPNQFISGYKVSQDPRDQYPELIIKQRELFVRNTDIEKFLAHNGDKVTSDTTKYDLSTIQPEERSKIILNYAVDVWEEYLRESNATPTINYIHNKIKTNPNFTRSQTNKKGDPKPSWSTLCKPVTETAINKEKKSEKRGKTRKK